MDKQDDNMTREDKLTREDKIWIGWAFVAGFIAWLLLNLGAIVSYL